ncbi:poly-gamma-glutamate hydrolase family protein [Desulfospira joergensenii]|uniref:poly-gamma-glutamate hydrolase family protein n=1 Tax=Desulfospira joergensenii TaxID=53329 RepID=UPI0003B7642D|nr:poly-gamma-glutamate hydrolase family protein [Desulfospira joergensenii]
MDRYPDFAALAAHETLNRDYRIRVRDLGTGITIMAPHGGRIEPRTSLIAEKIAGDLFNLYCFEGIKETGNRDLHITSHRFDEPSALDLISRSEIIVTIHACKERQKIVYVGGRFKDLALRIETGLMDINIASSEKESFPGTHPDNICNRGRGKKGVQLEISRGIRDDTKALAQVSKAVHSVLKMVVS